MLVIGQCIDRGDAAELSEIDHVLLRKGADDRAVNHAPHHTGGVLDRLATTELDIGTREEHHRATKLANADLEAHAGACG